MSNDYPEVAIVWVDTETDGLDAHSPNATLLEVACLVTDVQLNILDETGWAAVIHHDPDRLAQVRANSIPLVQQMHDRTGLWEKAGDPTQSIPLPDAQASLLAYVRQFAPKPRTARIGGNSVSNVDKDYLTVFMPDVWNHLHYRVADVSSLAGFAQWWAGVTPYQKVLAHTAQSDIRESIAEAKYLRTQLGLDRRPVICTQ